MSSGVRGRKRINVRFFICNAGALFRSILRYMTHLFKSLIIAIFATSFLVSANPAQALRADVSDWYIDTFKTDITVAQDGSLDIVEDITADCGTCSDKHGIFRILPYQITTREGDIFQTPIHLQEITDDQGQAYTFKQSVDTSNKTITWKIGDPDITVQGVNHYHIHYTVTNAIRNHDATQELYWNTVGAFWDLEIDHATATIHLPTNILAESTPLSVYGGPVGTSSEESSQWVDHTWTDPNTLVLASKQAFTTGDDITASLSFPANTFPTPSAEAVTQEINAMTGESPFWNAVFAFLMFILPIITLILCFLYWLKEGRDPVLNKTVIPEYDPPYGLSPLLLGAAESYGSLTSPVITAALIDLATHNVITIEEIPKTGFFGSVDYKFTKLPVETRTRLLSNAETIFLNNILANKETALFSEIKTEFGQNLKLVEQAAEEELVTLGFIDEGRTKSRAGGPLGLAGFIMFFVGFIALMFENFAGLGLLVSGVICFIFVIIMPRRSMKGADLLWQTKGFRLFMDTAEKYRQQFFEKEGSFEKLLPYAILFGMTKEWLKKMKELGVIPPETDGLHIHNVALSSGALLTSDTFSDMVSGIGDRISESTTSSSGSGGGGSSGGGGGGGGGGGW